MKTINRSFSDCLNDASDAVLRSFRHALRQIERMSWPSLLAMCILLALVVMILPLAFTLFVCFMLVKVVVGAFGVKHLPRPTEEKQGE
ncbi:hypothetical protein [Massilia endophytica]|uniref:hypothetical protein n=1 Tax=Massilia endophytica TaxID=2899220 RepID=UPI001E4BCD4A|nr:hypothetical protein [Massilia endophytica]UGQ47265.1 hypothetical protein LSQ66_01955 [Massilia endophytica]